MWPRYYGTRLYICFIPDSRNSAIRQLVFSHVKSVNVLGLSKTYKRQWTMASLILVLDCHPFVTKLLPETVMAFSSVSIRISPPQGFSESGNSLHEFRQNIQYRSKSYFPHWPQQLANIIANWYSWSYMLNIVPWITMFSSLLFIWNLTGVWEFILRCLVDCIPVLAHMKNY